MRVKQSVWGVCLALCLLAAGCRRAAVPVIETSATESNPTVISVSEGAIIAGATIALRASTGQVAIGDRVEVVVIVESVEGLYGAEVYLAFDPALLAVMDADADAEGVQMAPGDLLAPDIVVLNAADNSAGTIGYAVAQMHPHEPVDGDGALLHVAFEALASGEAEVTIQNALFASVDGEAIEAAVQGFVTIEIR